MLTTLFIKSASCKISKIHCINCQYVSKTFADYNTTSDGWLEWRGNQYFINRLSMPMDDARHFCQQRHGDMVSISSKDENTFLWKQVRIYFLNGLLTKNLGI